MLVVCLACDEILIKGLSGFDVFAFVCYHTYEFLFFHNALYSFNTFAKILEGNFDDYILWLISFAHTTYDIDFAVFMPILKLAKVLILLYSIIYYSTLS
jgi:hypothetical protein